MQLGRGSDDFVAISEEGLAAILKDPDRRRAFTRFDGLRVLTRDRPNLAESLARAISSLHDRGVVSDDARVAFVMHIVTENAFDHDPELDEIERERDAVMARLGLEGDWDEFQYVDEIFFLGEDWGERAEELVNRQLRRWGYGDIAELRERDEHQIHERQLRGEAELWGTAAREELMERLRAAMEDASWPGRFEP